MSVDHDEWIAAIFLMLTLTLVITMRLLQRFWRSESRPLQLRSRRTRHLCIHGSHLSIRRILRSQIRARMESRGYEQMRNTDSYSSSIFLIDRESILHVHESITSEAIEPDQVSSAFTAIADSMLCVARYKYQTALLYLRFNAINSHPTLSFHDEV